MADSIVFQLREGSFDKLSPQAVEALVATLEFHLGRNTTLAVQSGSADSLDALLASIKDIHVFKIEDCWIAAYSTSAAVMFYYLNVLGVPVPTTDDALPKVMEATGDFNAPLNMTFQPSGTADEDSVPVHVTWNRLLAEHRRFPSLLAKEDPRV